jgi:integrase
VRPLRELVKHCKLGRAPQIGWHAFRRGLASNLNRIGVDDSIIQSILRHSTVSVTQNHYIQNGAPGHDCSNAETVGCVIVLPLCSN